MEVYDLLVLGAGPAGMAAAIYAGRYDLKTLVVGNEVGGMANLAGEIENYPGFIGSGIDLMLKFKEQAEMFGAKFVIGNVDKLEKSEEGFKISVGSAARGIPSKEGTSVPSSSGKVFFGKSVILALGTEHRKLGISGEDEFLGKGVSYCATCDGNFFRGKTVAVVGGSDAAAKAAIYLASICEKVYVSYRKEKMRCEPTYLKKIEEIKNVEIFYGTKSMEIIGDTKVTGLRLAKSEVGNQKSEERVLDVDGVFVEIGSTPVTRIVEGVGVELEDGYLKVDREGRTSVEGLFAAGDLTNNFFKQVVTAAGSGAVAVKGVYEFLLG